MKKIICVLVVAALVAAGLALESRVLVRKDSAKKFDAFYGERANYDVLFIGNSHVLNGITPMELWNDFGISAYNMATSGGRQATSYWMLMAGLRETSPKLVVVECSYVSSDRRFWDTFINEVFDAMPMSRVKLRAALDLFDGDPKEIFEKVLFPFARYHSRWGELSPEDVSGRFPNLLGYEPLCNVSPAALGGQEAAAAEPVESVNMTYLEAIIRECRERDIQVLLTCIPFEGKDQDRNDAAWARHVAEENGLGYMAPDELAGALDAAVDFSNSSAGNSHLNHRGARKLTRRVGEYLTSHYDLPDRRGEAEYAHRADDYRDYLDYEDGLLRDTNRWKGLLMLSDNERYMPVIEVDSVGLWQEENFGPLAASLGVEADALGELPAVLVRERPGEPARRVDAAALSGEGVGTPLGRLRRGDDGALTMDGEVLFDPPADGEGARFALLDRETGALVRHFTLSMGGEGKIAVGE